jgi:hypothetical protein
MRLRLVSFGLTALLGLVTLAGCASTDDSSGEAEMIEVDESAINGGKIERSFTSAGLIDTATGSFCSGVLIRPNVVLTGAHCVLSDFGVNPPDGFYVGLGKATPGRADAVPAATRLKKYTIAQAVSFGKVDDILTNDCPHATPDIALLRLDQPVTEVAPAEIGDEPELGTECTAVGYGRHDISETKATKFQRRSARLTLTEVFPQALKLVNKTGITNGGDSGGPLFCDGKLVAITSCGPNDEALMQTDDYYARLSTVKARIKSQLTRWGID